MSQDERRANFIIRHATEYEADANFRKMVDNTVYLTDDERHKSMAIVENKFDGESRMRDAINNRTFGC